MREILTSGKGYSTELALQENELIQLKELITRQWLKRIMAKYPQHFEKFCRIGIERYHEYSNLVDHASLWPKKARMFPSHNIKTIIGMSVFKSLEDEFGKFTIADRDPQYGQLAKLDIYWRIVRPHQESDVGPMHADNWFWDVGTEANLPNYQEPVKVWIAVCCDPGKEGLRVVPGSHHNKIKYQGVRRDGAMKPQILKESEKKLNVQIVPTKPGDAIIFNFGLLHGGAIGTGEKTRISMECTIYIKK